MRHFISLKEQSKEDLLEILSLAMDLKQKRLRGEKVRILEDKTMIMLFQKTSTRTRLSYETAMTELGGHAIFVDSKNTQFSLTDFRDEIQAVMRFGHVLMFRALKAADVITAASFNRIPVIDACSEKYHPSQAIADMLTMIEKANGLENIKKVVWLGGENNVSNTLKMICVKLGIKIVLVAPDYDPSSHDEQLNQMTDNSGLVEKTLDLNSALRDASFVHTDTWMNMEFFDSGQIKPEYQQQYDKTIQLMMPYQLNADLINKYCPQAKIMHCMPCHIGYEISRDAIDHPNSVIFDQAENRLHAQKGMLQWLLT